jgi:hypothetical protein
MKYWFFQIMYDWYQEYWAKMVRAGVAAQHYVGHTSSDAGNITALSRLREGDTVIAAFKKHRFAGYGVLTSDFYRNGPSLKIYDPGDKRHFAFAERFDCDWTVIPFENDPFFIHCDDLKRQGFDIDLQHGFCVKQTDKATFKKIELRLDKAGARPYPHKPRVSLNRKSDGKHPPEKFETTRYLIMRDTPMSQELKTAYHNKCQICGTAIYLPDKKIYSEVHHIRPLGGDHRGVDHTQNMLVLCPNHHVMFDYGVPRFVSSKAVRIGKSVHTLNGQHFIDPNNIKYHNKHIRRG